MIIEPNIQEINKIFQFHRINDEIIGFQRLSGTTSGLVLRLESIQDNKYILKYDYPNEIQLVEQLLNVYQNSTLLPKVLFTSQEKTLLVYSYIDGTTHFNRGLKKNWLIILVKELFNKYIKYPDTDMWGRIQFPRRTWREFNETSIEEAKSNIGSTLSSEDFDLVKTMVNKLFKEEQEEKYLLHGDTGVHNFVYNQLNIIGVIDPSPMAGPLIYDFLYAFCSSPDDINTDTLFSAFDFLEQGRIEKSRLIEEVLVQLYCRIGICLKYHPGDLAEYKIAWEYWKKLCLSVGHTRDPY